MPEESPNFGTTVVTRETAPLAISGGTLLVTSDHRLAVAADPERDQLFIADLVNTASPVRTVQLRSHDEPGRMADGARQNALYVVLRGGSAVATIDTSTGAIIERREVCPAPRGIAYESRADSDAPDVIHVTCLDGDVVTLPAAGGTEIRRVSLGTDDLRDVVVRADHTLVVTRFRSATPIEVRADGTSHSIGGPPLVTQFDGQFQPAVAWRTVLLPDGKVAMVHQRGLVSAVQIQPGGYSGGEGSMSMCGGSIVHTTVTVLDETGTERPFESPAITTAVLPVDVAFSPDARQFAIAAAGNSKISGAQQVFLYNTQSYLAPGNGPCAPASIPLTSVTGQAVAVQFLDANTLIVQTREPSALQVVNVRSLAVRRVPLATDSLADTGHDVFHSNSGGFIACASCHPEGGDDGRVWTFSGAGPRRTQNLRGGMSGTEPFHWEGDQNDFRHLASEVFVGRMSGVDLSNPQVDALARWIDHIPTLPSPPAGNVSGVEHGRVLFNDPTVGCGNCHSGSKFTNNATVDVGTGGAFQVPTLVGVRWRAPFIHNGCAPTLRDRFSQCGGGQQHGRTAHLMPTDLDDLVLYLQTL